MSYSESVLIKATARLEDRRVLHQADQQARRRELYRALPELARIDRQLQGAMPQVVAAAFRKGEDPQEAVQRLREENLALQARRVQLLQEGGFSKDALEEAPFCPVCGDTGWRGSRMCQCLRRLCAQEQIKELSNILQLGEQSFEAFRLDCYGEEHWPAYGRSPRQNMEKVLAFARHYAEEFGGGSLPKNLFFYGGTGLGKTFLSACIARRVSEGGFSVVYDTAGAVFARFEEQKFSRDLEDARQARDVTRKYLRCDLLILDDLGSELTTPFVQSALYQLVNTRLASGRATVISSNFSVDELRGRYTPQIVSRLEGEYELLPFFGGDIRLQKKG